MLIATTVPIILRPLCYKSICSVLLLHNHPAVFFAVHVGGEVAFVDSDDVAAPGFPFGAFEPVDVEDVAVFAGEDGHVEDAVYFEVGEEVRAVG